MLNKKETANFNLVLANSTEKNFIEFIASDIIN